jgi:hypothetical protein
VCAYDECASDSDCTTNAVCICRETMLMAGVTGDPSWNTWCARAGNCRLDSDCGPGGYCSPSAQFQCSRMTYYYNYFCHTADDECVNDSDCPSQPTQSTLKPKADCAYNPAVGHWACSSADICSDG